MSDLAAPQDVLERIQKLLNLAGRNPNEHEAALASAKAQELLAQYNLDADAVASASVGMGAREKAAVEGGFYQYQRDLWKEVSELNFCLYWHQRYWNRQREKNKFGAVPQWMYRHSLIGRRVNVAATKAMASYLEEVATRLTKEAVRGIDDQPQMSNWANSYRRGIVARICRNLRTRRVAALAAEEELRANQARAADNASTSTAVSLMRLRDAEYDANIDFEFGEGTAASWAADRAERAAEARKKHEQYTRWAAANPEKAAAAEARRSRELRGRRRSSGGASNIDSSAFWRGYDAGKGVSIDQQVDQPKPAARIGRAR